MKALGITKNLKGDREWKHILIYVSYVSIFHEPTNFHLHSFQENPQSNKKEELESLDNPCDQRQDLSSEQNKGALDSSQCSPSPASQEDLESEISEDSDQEVDIEGDKGYFNAGWWPLTFGKFRKLDSGITFATENLCRHTGKLWERESIFWKPEIFGALAKQQTYIETFNFYLNGLCTDCRLYDEGTLHWLNSPPF